MVSVDRTLLGKMTGHAAREAARPGRRESSTRRAERIGQRLVTCGDDGSVRRHLLERLAVPAGAGGRRTSTQAVALRILEQPEDFPAVLAEQQTVRSYPRPFGINPPTCSAT